MRREIAGTGRQRSGAEKVLKADLSLPEGFKYRPELVSQADELSLLKKVKELPFKEFEFHGFVGKRRTVSYGWRYDFSEGSLRKAEEIPPFLISLRQAAAEFAGTSATQLQQVLVTEYGAGEYRLAPRQSRLWRCGRHLAALPVQVQVEAQGRRDLGAGVTHR